jgi:ubiquinone/menaquinone biosynthesis C-methylase UbiE
MDDRKTHWETVFQGKPSTELAWYQPRLALSVELIEATGLEKDAAILDVGGGDSTLVDDLLTAGFSNLTVVDVSSWAIKRSQARLAGRAARITWIEADITQFDLPAEAYHLWHDRATFHFLTDPLERGLYVLAARRCVVPGGYLVVATFSPQGPETCSGLAVLRYNPESLSREFGSHFTLLQSRPQTHRTPWGGEQSFQYCLFRKA